jgi:uncharacterized RDD family membrane protein YckC
MSTDDADLDQEDDEEAQLAEALLDKGALRLQLPRLSADRFGQVVGAFQEAGVANAVDAGGALVVAVPPPQSLPEVRATIGPAREEFERAMRERLAARRHDVYDVGDLTSVQIHNVLVETAAAGIETAYTGGELVVARRDAVAAEKIIDKAIQAGDQASPSAAVALTPAGWAPRLMGGLVDLTIALVILTVAGLALGSDQRLGVAIGFALVGVYQAVATAVWSRTLGKMLNDTRVIDANTGGRPTPLQSLIRAVPWFVAALAAPFDLSPAVLVGTYATILSTRRRVGIHDVLAKTSVVMGKPPPKEAAPQVG